MIARAILSLLCLNGLIIHMHIIFDRGHILMSEQFLQAERIVAQNEVADRKCMAKNVGTDPFPCDACSFFQAGEQQGHTIFRQWSPRFCKEQMILSKAAPFRSFLLVGSMTIYILKQIA